MVHVMIEKPLADSPTRLALVELAKSVNRS
jgi:predicted dehydrogenase